jgi:hypothetical protein
LRLADAPRVSALLLRPLQLNAVREACKDVTPFGAAKAEADEDGAPKARPPRSVCPRPRAVALRLHRAARDVLLPRHTRGASLSAR